MKRDPDRTPGRGGRSSPGLGTRVSPRPAGAKNPRPPAKYGRSGGHRAKPFLGRGRDSGPSKSWRAPKSGRVSFRARDYRPYRARGTYRDWRPRYHHYYYRTAPRYYIYGGWGSGWYDPWWYGNYWWPGYTHTTYTYHYDRDDYEPAIRETVYYEESPWMDAELHTTLTDIAIAWSTGEIELIQAHLTPGVAVAVRHDWEQEDPWILAAPVLLDIFVEALDTQTDGEFRFAQIEEMEPGLVWAIAEHSFRLEGEGRRSATMEFMFRQYDNTWLVEAVVASPEKYWWADSELLDDAARESARLLEEMDRAQALEAD